MFGRSRKGSGGSSEARGDLFGLVRAEQESPSWIGLHDLLERGLACPLCGTSLRLLSQSQEPAGIRRRLACGAEDCRGQVSISILEYCGSGADRRNAAVLAKVQKALVCCQQLPTGVNWPQKPVMPIHHTHKTRFSEGREAASGEIRCTDFEVAFVASVTEGDMDMLKQLDDLL